VTPFSGAGVVATNAALAGEFRAALGIGTAARS
jgi:hypothetical protein